MLDRIIWATKWFCLAVFLCWILAATYSFGTACPKPDQAAHHKTDGDNPDSPCSFRESLSGRFITWVGREIEHDNSPLVAVGTWALAVFTLGLFTYTGLLWASTRDMLREQQKAAERVRSIIRGSGRRHEEWGDDVFLIEVSNAGTGPALIETVEWNFGSSSMLGRPPSYGQPFISNEMVHPQVRTQVVRHVRIPAGAEIAFQNPVIAVRIVYYDVNRRRRGSIGFVMLLDSPDIRGVSVFVNAPAPYLEDTFPLHE